MDIRLFLLLFGIFVCSACFLNAAGTEGFTKIKELGGIEEFQFNANGLTVLLMENHAVPVATLMVTYNVGSRNEATGITGATHFLEHMMFRGTEKYNKEKNNSFDQFFGKIGARKNASTWLDRTNYYETVSKEYLEQAIIYEADRMRNLLLFKSGFEAEKTVILNELDRGENNPGRALLNSISAAAFCAHPYHNPVIGWRSDVENVSVEKLRGFYDTFYWPNNATVTIIGDFDKKEALALIKKYFGQISRSPCEIPKVYTVEPKQEGVRRVVLKRPGQSGIVGIGYKTPAGVSQDTYALIVLDAILGEGKTSRFYKNLVDTNLAVEAGSFYRPFRDPELMICYAYVMSGVSHEDVEKKFLEVFEKIKAEGVTDQEVERAIKKIIAQSIFERDGSFSIANEINEAIAMGDWTFFVNYLENIQKVTPSDICALAKKYLTVDQSTVGYFIPQEETGCGAGGSRKPNQYFFTSQKHSENEALFGNSLAGAKDVLSLAKNIQRKRINGIDLITVKTGQRGFVVLRGGLFAGDVYGGSKNSMVADLTGNMLDKGTKSLDKFQLAEQLEDLGASLKFGVDAHNLLISGRCLKSDIEKAVGLLAEQLRNPAFDKEELGKLKKTRAGDFLQLMDNTDARASLRLKQMLFEESHPNCSVSMEQALADIKKVTIDEIKSFHKKYYGPKSLICVVAGDLEHENVQNVFSRAFVRWEGGVEKGVYPEASFKTENGLYVVKMEGKSSVSVEMGQITGLKRIDADFLPFFLGNCVLGDSMSARLMSIIREKEGLTYGIYSSHAGDTYTDGYWYVGATFAPEDLERGIFSTKREVKGWVEEGISEEELKNIKSRRKGLYLIQLETVSGLADQLLAFIKRGFDVNYIDRFPLELEEVTLEQVNQVIKKYVNLDKVVVVVAGSIDAEGKPLKKK